MTISPAAITGMLYCSLDLRNATTSGTAISRVLFHISSGFLKLLRFHVPRCHAARVGSSSTIASGSLLYRSHFFITICTHRRFERIGTRAMSDPLGIFATNSGRSVGSHAPDTIPCIPVSQASRTCILYSWIAFMTLSQSDPFQ